jgi:hypothetical protein
MKSLQLTDDDDDSIDRLRKSASAESTVCISNALEERGGG